MAKGSKTPPGAITGDLEKAGAGPPNTEWPPSKWKNANGEPCWIDRVKNLKWGRHDAACTASSECGPPTVIAIEPTVGTPLTYLYKPASVGLWGDGCPSTPNRFTLRDGQCDGSTKVLLFVTGAAVDVGSVGGSCASSGIWPNNHHVEITGAYIQYLAPGTKGWPPIGNGDGQYYGFVNDDYTLSLWIRCDPTTKPGLINPLVSWMDDQGPEVISGLRVAQIGPSPGGSSGNGWGWHPWVLMRTGSHITASLLGQNYAYKAEANPPALGGQGKIYAMNAPIATGNWEHFAFTFHSASQTLTLYLNGIAVSDPGGINKINDDGIDTFDGPVFGTLRNFSIGAAYTSPDPVIQNAGSPFSGALDEVSYWNTNLNAAEIYEIYESSQYCSAGPNNLNMHSKKDNLMTWWRMDPFSTGWNDAWMQNPNNCTSIQAEPGECVKVLNSACGASAVINMEMYPGYGSIEAGAPGPGVAPLMFPSDGGVAGAGVKNGEHVGNPPWIAVSGAFPNSNENIIMLPGSRVELTWAPAFSGAAGTSTAMWTTSLMHSGCYSCGGFGPKAYLIGAIPGDAAEWPPP